MDILIIMLRLIHIIGGTFWVGSALGLAFFVEPVASSAGAIGGQFMQRFGQGRYGAAVSAAAILTILAGLALFVLRGWSLTEPKGLTFGIGGLAGILALGIGGALSGPTAAKLGRLGAEVQASGKPPTQDQMQQLQAYQAQLGQSSRITAALALLATLLMAVARYL